MNFNNFFSELESKWTKINHSIICNMKNHICLDIDCKCDCHHSGEKVKVLNE